MKKIISYVLLILWLLVIFNLSSQPGTLSGGESSHLIYNTLEFIYSIFHLDSSNLSEVVSVIHNPLRECMHSLEYFILAILTVNLLKQHYIKENIFVISILFCFVYAATDEIHQLFVPGRSFEYFDIFMDMLGSIIGTWMMKIFSIKKVN